MNSIIFNIKEYISFQSKSKSNLTFRPYVGEPKGIGSRNITHAPNNLV